jgi:methyl-accepting chemotaxis protein
MLSRLPIGQRLAIAMGTALTLLVIVVTLAVMEVRSISNSLDVVNDINSVKQRYAINFRGSVHDRAISLRDVVLNGDIAAAERDVADIERLAADYDRSAGPLDAMMADPALRTAEEVRILGTIKAIEAETQPLIERVIALRRAGEIEAAHRILMEDARPRFGVWLARINEFIDFQEAANQSLGAEVRELAGAFTLTMVLATLVALAAAVAVGLVVVRSISRPLAGMMSAMRAIANGDETARIPWVEGRGEIKQMAEVLGRFQKGSAEQREQEEANRRRVEKEREAERAKLLAEFNTGFGTVVERATQGDLSARVAIASAESEIGRLGSTFNRVMELFESVIRETVDVVGGMARGDLSHRMPEDRGGAFRTLAESVNGTMARLEDTIAQVDSASAGIDAVARLISQNADRVVDSSNSQAGSIAETMATMEEMTATVRSNAENAEHARKQARDASAVAERGGRVVQDAAGAMQRIDASSSRISDIISVIDTIAFQTNLLALNAAVEAARAGDAGKGFAVVASEVRSLAQRSSESARDIRQLIDTASSNVAEGVQLVGTAAQALNEILAAISSVAASVDDITAASREQAVGTESISNAMGELDRKTVDNTAVARANTDAARELAERSGELNRSLDVFRKAPRKRRAA